MRFLFDTNCWMQVIREREHATEVRDLVREIGAANMATTDFSLHSIVIAMRRHKMLDKLPDFLRMSDLGQSVELVRLPPKELIRVAEVSTQHGLDVEDAYQYAAAELNNLRLVSLDADFDRTPRGRLTPAQALEEFKKQQ